MKDKLIFELTFCLAGMMGHFNAVNFAALAHGWHPTLETTDETEAMRKQVKELIDKAVTVTK